MTRRSIWFSLRASLWFVPFLSLLLCTAGALILVQIDLHFDARIRSTWPAYLQAGPEGARQILATIGSSMITVTGVVFSVTIVTLSLTANQYSPRVLRNFMRSRLNQTVLGVFVGVFIYSLLVLQAIGSEHKAFVPQLALWVGIFLVIISIGFLIAFIHNTATSIQASEIVAKITTETVDALGAVRRMSDEGVPASIDPSVLSKLQWRAVLSHESGYVQDIDMEKLYALACARQVVLRVECPVGDFIVAGRSLVSVSGQGDMDKKFVKTIQHLFGINSYRTIEQDPAFGVRQIVDVALRALSPGINDATTAINCIDCLAVILHHASRVDVLPEVHADDAGPRIVLRQLKPEHLADVALNEIRQNASGNVAVLLRLLRLLRQLLEDLKLPHLRAHLRHHAHLIGEQAERTIPATADKTAVARALQRTLAAGPSLSETKVTPVETK